MHRHQLLAAIAAAMGTFAGPAAHAGTGQIDSFSASQTSIFAGGRVDFFAYFGVQTSAGSYGGNDPAEPAPQEGQQTWLVNWYVSDSELLNHVSLQGGGNSFLAYPGIPAGSSYSGQWTFSMDFADPGVYTIEIGGGWMSNVQHDSGQEIATRDCFNVDPGGSNELSCTPWIWSYPQMTYDEVSQGMFEARGIEIQVLAAVPEPATAWLWACGLVGMAASTWRRRR